MVIPLLIRPAVGQAPAVGQEPETIQVGPYAKVASRSFHLNPGNSLVVTGKTQEAPFAVNLYVYDQQKVLVGKDNEDSASEAFEWQPSEEGDYYMMAHNVGQGRGSISIAVIRSKAPPPPAAANYAEMRIFYATDRIPTGKKPPTAVYGQEPDSQQELHFGECLVSIPRDHRMGELEGPSIYRLEFHQDPQKHIVLLRVDEESQSYFFSRVRGRIANSEHKQALVFVHGFNTSFEDATRRTAQIAYDLGFDGPAITYSWPSQGSLGLVAYNKDGRNAELTAPHLQQFLSELSKQSGATTIHLIAHSMGNRPLTTALKQMPAAGRTLHPTSTRLS